MNKFTSALILLIVVLHVRAHAQQIRPDNSYKIYQELNQLDKLLNVLYVAAHPDDENTRLLSWLANGANASTAYLSLTRGDGGQNLLGEEQGAALGLIRTQELLRARKTDGASQYFTRAIDFGFSKNKEETFEKWDEDKLVGDVVWTIRKLRPQVIICRFPPDKRAGHGQHAASAVVARKAFEAAGDATKYPEQLKYLKPFKPVRLLFNTFRFGSANTITDNQLKITTGQYDAGLGMGYGELAGISRSLHHSQGEGTPSVAGQQLEHFETVEGSEPQASLFDGINTSWAALNRPDISNAIQAIRSSYQFNAPSASLKALLSLRKMLSGLNDPFWKKQKLAELDHIIINAAGIMAELYSPATEMIPGASADFTLNLVSRGALPVTAQNLIWQGQDIPLNKTLGNDILFTAQMRLNIDKHTPITEPYWLKSNSEDGFHYAIPQLSDTGLPGEIRGPEASIRLRIADEQFTVKVPLSRKYLDPIKGDVIDPLRIVPPLGLDFAHKVLIKQDKGVETSITVSAQSEIENAELAVFCGDKEFLTLSGLHFRAGTDSVIQVSIPDEKLVFSEDGVATLSARLRSGDGSYTRMKHLISYSHIPQIQYFTDCSAKVLRADWKVNAPRIGYISGAGDYTLEFLKTAGLHVEELGSGDLISADKLDRYSTIILGVRALNVDKRLSFVLPALFAYVQRGGKLVIQYNKPQGLVTQDIGPYPMGIANLRVTEEDATVRILKPGHRILNYPNKIDQNDFKGWIQERGLYFIGKWDARYDTVLSMNDKGEQPLDGSLLYSKYGKGEYIYTGLSFFRQLPAGNPGAVKLFMNLISN